MHHYTGAWIKAFTAEAVNGMFLMAFMMGRMQKRVFMCRCFLPVFPNP